MKPDILARPGLPDPLVSAVVEPGVITNRVKQVRRTRAGKDVARAIERAATRAAADQIAAARRLASGSLLPAVEVPAVEVPAVEVPAVEVPAVEVPAVEVPAVEVPAVEVQNPTKSRQRSAVEPRHRLPADKRRPLRTRGVPNGWYQLCVSVPADVLSSLDAAIERISAAGAGKPSRSRLIRIALARLDVEALIDELRRTR